MGKYLIVGLPGVGKTTLLAELARRGYATVDADFDPGLTGWINKESGNIVAEWSEEQNTAPTGCTWGWDRQTMIKLTSNPPGDPFFFGGNTAGMEQYYPLFDMVFALVANDATVLYRLTSERNNPHNYGKKPEHVAETLAMNASFREQEERRGSVIVDAEQSVATVADDIEACIQ